MDRFCRTCLHRIPRDSLFFQLDGHDLSSVAVLIRSQLQACIPEMRVGVVKNSVLCNPCLNDLTSAYKFKNKCLETEKQILDYILHADLNTDHVDINLLIKRIANNSSSQKHENGPHPQSKLGFHKETVSFRKLKAKHKEPDCTIHVIVGKRKRVKKPFINDYSKEKFINENNLAKLTSSNVKIVGTLSEFISVDDIRSSVMNGIEKKPKHSQSSVETMLGKCIDINDSDEEIIDMILPTNDDVSSVQLNNSDIKESFCKPKDNIEMLDFETEDQSEANIAEIKNVKPANLCCDNNRIPKSKHHKYFKKTPKAKYPKTCKSKKRKLKKINRANVNNKNSSFINNPSKSKSTVTANSLESADKPVEHATIEDALPVDTPESNSITESKEQFNHSIPSNRPDIAVINTNTLRDELPSPVQEHARTEDALPVDTPESNSVIESKEQFNNSVPCNHPDISVINTNTLRDELPSPGKCPNSVVIKEECESSEPLVAEECRRIEIKDEVIIKDECEFQHHKTKIQELHSRYPMDDLKNNETFCNMMEADELQLDNLEASTLQPCKLLPGSNDFNNEPSYREARKGLYSCAVCSYSCNSERILVSHTEVHANKNSYKYDDDVIFCGFTYDDLELTSCSRCKYAKSESFLIWLKPEVVLTKCESE